MPVFEHQSLLPANAAEVFKWHMRPGAFERLSPPWLNVRVLERHGGVADGGRVTLQLRKGPLAVRWVLLHKDIIEGRQFVDEQVKGPWRHWRHVHRFEPAGETACTLHDKVEYDLPAGRLGESLAGTSIDRMLGQLFLYRHEQLRHDLQRHRLAAGKPPQRIIVTGASGLIGSALCAFLTSGGHRVDRLVREMPHPGGTDVYWSPAKGEIDATGLEGADIVVHLAGESLIGRWTPTKKRTIRDSRVGSTQLLAEAIAKLSRRPRVLVSASAIGYYGDRGAEQLTEEAPAGSGFLAEVCQSWEQAAEPARQAGVRVVHPRIGVVLSGRGGALPAMAQPFQLGLGGTLGSGCQYVSWIDMDDLLGALHLAMFRDDVVGPLNAVSPQPVLQRDLAKALGRVLRRPAAIGMPGPLLKIVLGELADAGLLASQRVVPATLARMGFTFHRSCLEDSLRRQLGRFAKV